MFFPARMQGGAVFWCSRRVRVELNRGNSTQEAKAQEMVAVCKDLLRLRVFAVLSLNIVAS
jgi:hypothetical protein